MNGVRNANCACHIGRENARSKAKIGIIGHLDRLFLGIETQSRQNGAKHFFAHSADILVRAVQYGGGVIPARIKSLGALAPVQQRGSFPNRIIDRLADMIELLASAQGSDLGIVCEWIANTDLACAFDQFFEDLLANTRLDEYSRSGNTTLPGGSEVTGDNTVHGALEIGVIKNQNWRFTTQLQRYHGKIFGGIAHDMTRGFRAAGKRDPGHVRMAG